MTIEVTNTSGQLVPATEINSLLTFALLELALNPECEVSVSFVDDDYMTELHIKWMDEPGTTDVLSFPMDMPQTPGEAVTLGDIVISPVVACRAGKSSRSFNRARDLHFGCTWLVTYHWLRPC